MIHMKFKKSPLSKDTDKIIEYETTITITGTTTSELREGLENAVHDISHKYLM